MDADSLDCTLQPARFTIVLTCEELRAGTDCGAFHFFVHRFPSRGVADVVRGFTQPSDTVSTSLTYLLSAFTVGTNAFTLGIANSASNENSVETLASVTGTPNSIRTTVYTSTNWSKYTTAGSAGSKLWMRIWGGGGGGGGSMQLRVCVCMYVCRLGNVERPERQCRLHDRHAGEC